METILIRYSEIALKGKNRTAFENRLIRNIRRSVEGSIKKVPGRILAWPEDAEKAAEKLRRIPGIASISIAHEINADLCSIKEEALRQARKKSFSTFRITATRSVKKLKPSPEIEKEVGAFIVENTGKKVKLKGPDLQIFIEIGNNAYIFTEKSACLGGLPEGIEGLAALLVDGRKSILAGLLAMRRGCRLFPIAFKKTDLKKTDISLLEKYGFEGKLAVADSIEEADKIAEKNDCKAIITSQDSDSLKDLRTKLPVLRPLVGISPEMAKKMLGLSR